MILVIVAITPVQVITETKLCSEPTFMNRDTFPPPSLCSGSRDEHLDARDRKLYGVVRSLSSSLDRR